MFKELVRNSSSHIILLWKNIQMHTTKLTCIAIIQRNTNNNKFLKLTKSVNFFAIGPDLAVRAGERAKVSHLHHSIGKICQKGAGVGAVSVNLTIRRTPTKQLLV